MQGYSFEEVILQGKRAKKYRLAVRFEDPQYGPLALFLNSEAGVFGAEIAEALEQAQAAMGQTEFTGNLCTAVITPFSAKCCAKVLTVQRASFSGEWLSDM